jgi:hypothetical protein
MGSIASLSGFRLPRHIPQSNSIVGHTKHMNRAKIDVNAERDAKVNGGLAASDNVPGLF